MKILTVVGMAILMAACSMQPARCHGALQPINTSVAAGKEPKAGSEPKTGKKEPHP
jgi:hypothetical protein